jgi:hypothetical protein
MVASLVFTKASPCSIYHKPEKGQKKPICGVLIRLGPGLSPRAGFILHDRLDFELVERRAVKKPSIPASCIAPSPQ